MSWFGNMLKFEGFHGKQILKDLGDKPQRILYGSFDPFSTKLWNGILGTHDKPIIDQMGGATQDRYRQAEAAGIDTSAGKGAQNVAHVLAAIAAAGYGADAAGIGGGGAGAGGGLETGAGAGAGAGSGGIGGGSLEFGGVGSGMGMGTAPADLIAQGGMGAGGAGAGGGGYSLGGTYIGQGSSAAAAPGWQQYLKSGMQGFNNAKPADNSAQIRQQEQMAEMLRRHYEEQQQAAQQMPGWINTSGGA